VSASRLPSRVAGPGRARPRAPGAARRVAARPGGFTLIELLIAVALMAVLALLGWRGLDSVLVSRDRIVEASDSLRALSVGFTQMDEDLRRAWSVRLLRLPVPAIAFVADDPQAPPALQVLRESPAGGGADQLQRVVYRVRDGVLERGFSAWAPPRTPDAAAPTAPPMTWQPLIAGVAHLHFRAWITGQGWVPGAALLLRPGVAAFPTPVSGVEVSLERRDGERVLRVFAVKD